MQIKIIGLGGIGSSLASFVSRYLSFTYIEDEEISITLIDGDSYEERNRDRQSFTKLDYKAENTADRLNQEFPEITHMGISEYIIPSNIEF